MAIEFASLPGELPRLANSVLSTSHSRMASCDEKKNEFASLPRFLSRGGLSQNAQDSSEPLG
jgi:hypothetical protein